MVNRYIKHIIALLFCCTGITTGALCQQTDSAAAGIDTAKHEALADGSDSTKTEDDTTTKTPLAKFNLKEQTLSAAQKRIPAADVKKITADKDFWYANKPIPGEEPVEAGGWAASILRIVFWVLVAAIGVGILVLCIRLFSFKGKGLNMYETTEEQEATENIFDIDFDARIAKALEAQDYRLATRLLFLRLLRGMAERNIIQYGIDKTNLDYLFQLGNSRYFNDFSTVARYYEYVWYGNFNIQQSQFILLRQRLDELNRQINN